MSYVDILRVYIRMEQKQETVLQVIHTKDTYMLLGGILMIGGGVYCMANGGVSAIKKYVSLLTR